MNNYSNFGFRFNISLIKYILCILLINITLNRTQQDSGQLIKPSEKLEAFAGFNQQRFSFNHSFKEDSLVDQVFKKKIDNNKRLMLQQEDPQPKNKNNILYKQSENQDFRFINMIVTKDDNNPTIASGSIIKINMDTLDQKVIWDQLDEPQDLAIDQIHHILYFTMNLSGGKVHAVPFQVSPTEGLTIIARDETEIGLILDLSMVDEGYKPINGPREILVDGNSNLLILSTNEDKIFQFQLELEENSSKTASYKRFKFAKNMLKNRFAKFRLDLNTIQKKDQFKYINYKEFYKVQSIKSYRVDELYSCERPLLIDTQCMQTFNNIVVFGRTSIDAENNIGPLTKGQNQNYSTLQSPLKSELNYDFNDPQSFKTIISIEKDDQFLWVSSKEGQIGIIPYSQSYQNEMKNKTVQLINQGQIKEPASMTFDNTNKLMFVLDKSDGKVQFFRANQPYQQEARQAGITVPNARNITLFEFSKEQNDHLWNMKAVKDHRKKMDMFTEEFNNQ